MFRFARRLLQRLTSRKLGPLDRQPQALPLGTYVLPLAVKQEYDPTPFHVYHATPFQKITVLRHRQRPHEWFVAGSYLGPFVEGGVIRGQIYKPVIEDRDKEAVLSQIKSQDKDANVHFSVERV